MELANKFIADGVPTRSDAFFGNGISTGNNIAEASAANPDLTLPGGWTFDTTFANRSVGGCYFIRQSTGTSDFIFTPQKAANRFEVLFATGSGLGDVIISDSTGALDTFTTAAASTGYIRRTVPRSIDSADPIKINRTGTGGDIRCLAVIPYSTNTPMLEIWNMGYAGSSAALHWIAANLPYSPFNMLAEFVADLAYVELGLNDKNTSVTAANFQAALSSILNKIKTVTPNIQVAKPHQAAAGSSYLLASDYLSAIDAAVAAASLPSAIDHFNQVALVAATDRYDDVHLTNAGYVKKAAFTYPIIKARSGR